MEFIDYKSVYILSSPGNEIVERVDSLKGIADCAF